MLRENKFYKFYEQVKQESYKVIWPDKKEVMTSTGIVMLVVFVFSIICLVLDYSIHTMIRLLLNIHF